MTIKILNADKLVRKLKKLPDIAEKRIKEAMEKSADQTVMLMKRLAPVDKGDLQKSITWSYGDAPEGSLRIKQFKSAEGNVRISIYAGGPDAFYARWIELGRREYTAGGKFSGATVEATPAQPFFYPGWRASRRTARSRISRAITRAAKEVAANG